MNKNRSFIVKLGINIAIAITAILLSFSYYDIVYTKQQIHNQLEIDIARLTNRLQSNLPNLIFESNSNAISKSIDSELVPPINEIMLISSSVNSNNPILYHARRLEGGKIHSLLTNNEQGDDFDEEESENTEDIGNSIIKRQYNKISLNRLNNLYDIRNINLIYKDLDYEETIATATITINNHEVSNIINNKKFEILIKIGILNLSFITVILFLVIHIVVNPLNKISSTLQKISINQDCLQKLPEDRNDEIGSISHNFNKYIYKIYNLIAKINKISKILYKTSIDDYEIGKKIQSFLHKQQQQIENLKILTSDTTNYSTEVCSNSNQIIKIYKSTKELCTKGEINIKNNINKIDQLVDQVKSVSKSTTSLTKNSKKITEMLESIKSISEQTNKIMLNTAIEAAQADKQSIDFVVIVEQVRSLSNQAYKALSSIQHTVDTIQKNTVKVEKNLVACCDVADSCKENINHVYATFNDTYQSIEGIYKITDNISKSVEQQNKVDSNINTNINKINEYSFRAIEMMSTYTNKQKDFIDIKTSLQNAISKFVS